MRFTLFRPKSWPHRGNSAISEPEMMISSGEIARRYYRQPTFHPSGINVCGRHLHIYRFPDCFFVVSLSSQPSQKTTSSASHTSIACIVVHIVKTICGCFRCGGYRVIFTFWWSLADILLLWFLCSFCMHNLFGFLFLNHI